MPLSLSLRPNETVLAMEMGEFIPTLLVEDIEAFRSGLHSVYLNGRYQVFTSEPHFPKQPRSRVTFFGSREWSSLLS